MTLPPRTAAGTYRAGRINAGYVSWHKGGRVEPLAQLASMAGISVATLHRPAAAGDFPPSIRAGRCRLVTCADAAARAAAQRSVLTAP